MSAKAETLLWVMQRASAAVLGLCVLVHLGTMIYAVRGGLTAAEILSRTRGSAAWLAFYTVFVLAISLHVPIGLRTVLGEWLGWRGAVRSGLLFLFALAIAFTGMRAVIGVYS